MKCWSSAFLLPLFSTTNVTASTILFCPNSSSSLRQLFSVVWRNQTGFFQKIVAYDLTEVSFNTVVPCIPFICLHRDNRKEQKEYKFASTSTKHKLIRTQACWFMVPPFCLRQMQPACMKIHSCQVSLNLLCQAIGTTCQAPNTPQNYTQVLVKTKHALKI